MFVRQTPLVKKVVDKKKEKQTDPETKNTIYKRNRSVISNR